MLGALNKYSSNDIIILSQGQDTCIHAHARTHTHTHTHTHTQFLRNVMNTYSLFAIRDFSFYRDEFFLQGSS